MGSAICCWTSSETRCKLQGLLRLTACKLMFENVPKHIRTDKRHSRFERIPLAPVQRPMPKLREYLRCRACSPSRSQTCEVRVGLEGLPVFIDIDSSIYTVFRSHGGKSNRDRSIMRYLLIVRSISLFHLAMISAVVNVSWWHCSCLRLHTNCCIWIHDEHSNSLVIAFLGDDYNNHCMPLHLDIIHIQVAM